MGNAVITPIQTFTSKYSMWLWHLPRKHVTCQIQCGRTEKKPCFKEYIAAGHVEGQTQKRTTANEMGLKQSVGSNNPSCEQSI